MGKVVLTAGVLMCCVFLTLLLDSLEAGFHDYTFYLSESLLFSSFWWIFLPLLYGQLCFANKYKANAALAILILSPIVVHIFAYPALVWVISALFYPHTFVYQQTLNYEITEYSFILLLFYVAPFIFYVTLKRDHIAEKNGAAQSAQSSKKEMVASLIVTAANKHIHIETKDILFISANTPYVNIIHRGRRYLYNDTLKSISAKMDGSIFVQVHKSVIVNLVHVHTYKSRLNGDYDLTMTDGQVVRLSRNYASEFKLRFKSHPHQDTTV